MGRMKGEPLRERDLAGYLCEEAKLFAQPNLLTVTELSVGNINFIFRVLEQETGKSVIVKQAMPYMRIFPDSWPLDPRRAEMELSCNKVHGEALPTHVPKVLFHDLSRGLIVYEDLSHLSILREMLLAGELRRGVGKEIGRYVAITGFRTSNFALALSQRAALQARFNHTELQSITEEVFFNQPYYDCPSNNFCEEYRKEVESLWGDSQLKGVVAALQFRFLSARSSHTRRPAYWKRFRGTIRVQGDRSRVLLSRPNRV